MKDNRHERTRTEDHEIDIFQEEDFTVWLNPYDGDFAGVVIGEGEKREDAIDDAIDILRKTIDKLKTLRRIKAVYRTENGMVLVFDERGEQIPAYQGRWTEHREDILRDAPTSTEFFGLNYRTRETWPLNPSEEFHGPQLEEFRK